ncbi:MAG TPA: hypothetical protein VHL99_02660 [Candidatus Binatia bacterium]|nr:hypothetical protein [Candidatus Binatia bacterium]
MVDLSVEPLVELLPAELPAPDVALEPVPLCIPEDEEVELCLSDDSELEPLPEPAALEAPEPETAPDVLEPSLAREVDVA